MRKQKMRLTKRIIDKLTYEGKVSPKGTPGLCIFWDLALDGFGVRVHESGRKAYALTYYAKGRKRFISIGKCSQITLERARKKALALLQQVNEGEDPAEERRQQRQILTVKEFIDLYEARYARKFLRPITIKFNLQRIERYILPAWGSRRLDSVTRSDVARLHSQIGETAPVQANRVVQLIRSLYNVAVTQGCLPDGFLNPAKNIKTFNEEPRTRTLSDDELRRIGEALRQEETAITPALIRFILICGSRIGETLKSTWDEIDFKKGTWTIPASHAKGKRSRTLPLPHQAIEMLKSIPHLSDDDRIFPLHPETVRNAWKKICKSANVEGVTVHDVRRSAITRMIGDGADVARVAKISGHRDVDMTLNVYAHPTSDNLRETVEKHADNIVEFLDLKKEMA
ncbi:MAG: tyrosine-type recombinase/integrase [bacterium]